jgi:RNA polymerase sigma factor (sigma-70 family)
VMALDDDVLWSRSREGDAEAFGVLFERHAKAIYNYCFRRVGDWSQAEDLVSIVFLETWRRRDKELAADKVLPWLYGVATNVLRNRRRAERRFASAIKRLPVPQPQPDFADDVDERVDDQRRMRQALQTIEELSIHEQDVFALCVWEGMSYEHAAAALNVPVGTVRSRLSRARQHLRELGVASGHELVANPIVQEALEP